MNEYIDYLRELLAPLGTIRVRRMFGGWGLYCDEQFFAIVADHRLYLKVDARSEPAFRAAGCAPFVYSSRGKALPMSYWSLPDEAFDSAEAMQPWAERGYAAARRQAAAKAAQASNRRSPRRVAAAPGAGAKPGQRRR